MSASPAMEAALAEIARRAPIAVRHDVKAGARLMVAKPWRIQSALFPNVLGKVPSEVSSLLATAARQERGQATMGLTGHWAYSFNRHIAAKEALLALRVLRRRGVVSVEAAL